MQLVDPERTPHEDEHDARELERQEEQQSPSVRERAAPLAVARGEIVGEEGDEDDQRHDLEDEAGEGDVDADLDVVEVARDARDGAAGGLEDEGDDVEGDEDVVEELGAEAGDGRVDVLDAGGC
jgi:hypothetical protein